MAIYFSGSKIIISSGAFSFNASLCNGTQIKDLSKC